MIRVHYFIESMCVCVRVFFAFTVTVNVVAIILNLSWKEKKSRDKKNSPLCTLQCFWDIVWILFHQVGANAKYWQINHFAPIQFGHIEEEQLLILWRQLIPHLLHILICEIPLAICKVVDNITKTMDFPIHLQHSGELNREEERKKEIMMKTESMAVQPKIKKKCTVSTHLTHSLCIWLEFVFLWHNCHTRLHTQMFAVIGRHFENQSNTLEFGQFCDSWAQTHARTHLVYLTRFLYMAICKCRTHFNHWPIGWLACAIVFVFVRFIYKQMWNDRALVLCTFTRIV